MKSADSLLRISKAVFDNQRALKSPRTPRSCACAATAGELPSHWINAEPPELCGSSPGLSLSVSLPQRWHSYSSRDRRSAPMHKQNLIGMATAGAILASIIIMAAPASAGWNNCGCRSYGYYAPRAYSYAPARWAYRSYYRPAAFYGASFYRPRVWGWRGGWGGRHWGWRGGWGRRW